MFLAIYVHLIPHPDCVGGVSHRELDSATELMAVLTVCRHGLHQGVMGFMLGLSKATIHRIFIGWVIFLATPYLMKLTSNHLQAIY